MRAPDQSFKTELRAYRKKIEAIATDRKDPRRRIVLSMLDRWETHADAENAWKQISNASAANGKPMPPPGVFIAWVIRTRMDLERLPEVSKQAPRLEAKAHAQANRDWKEGRTASAVMKREFAQQFSEEKKRVLGRQPRLAPQKRFIKMWRDTFIENCGKPLHGVVATLAEIAFDFESFC